MLCLFWLFSLGCAHEHFFEATEDGGVGLDEERTPELDSSAASANVDGLSVDTEAFVDANAFSPEAIDPNGSADLGDQGEMGLDGAVQGADGMVDEESDAGTSMDMETDPIDASLAPDMEQPQPSSVGYSLCGEGLSTRVGVGTWSDPVQVGRFPFLDRASTSDMGERLAERYDCAESTGELGTEVVYRFTIESSGDFIAQVVDEGNADIDLHLLRDPSVDSGLVSGCIGRAHQKLEVPNLEAGDYLLVADSWSSNDGRTYEGAFELVIDVFQTRTWLDVPLAQGVRWLRYQGPYTSEWQPNEPWQQFNVLEISPAAMSRLIIAEHDGCQTVSQKVGGEGFLAGVNGGYFGSGCTSRGFLRVADETRSLTVATISDPPLSEEARVGWRDESIWFFWREARSDWTLPRFAIGAHPMLNQDGEPDAQVQEGQRVFSATDWAFNPRTALAHTTDGKVLLVTVDGRTPAGAGMNTPELANWLDETFDVRSAINLDGGGSTTFVVNGCWVGSSFGEAGVRVFNAPSDNGLPDSNGARGVSNGIYLQ